MARFLRRRRYEESPVTKLNIHNTRCTSGPSADKKTLRKYTNVESPDQFAQPPVVSRSLLLVLYLQQGPCILCRRTAQILTRLHGCACWSVFSLFAYILWPLFSAAGPTSPDQNTNNFLIEYQIYIHITQTKSKTIKIVSIKT